MPGTLIGSLGIDLLTYLHQVEEIRKDATVCRYLFTAKLLYISVSQPWARGPVPGPGISYTGPREVLLEFVILVF